MNRFTPKNYPKSFSDTSESHKRKLTCLLELTSGSFLIGRRGILVISKNHPIGNPKISLFRNLGCLKTRSDLGCSSPAFNNMPPAGLTKPHSVGYQVIPSHGNPQMRWTLFDGYLFKYCSMKY